MLTKPLVTCYGTVVFLKQSLRTYKEHLKADFSLRTQ